MAYDKLDEWSQLNYAEEFYDPIINHRLNLNENIVNMDNCLERSCTDQWLYEERLDIPEVKMLRATYSSLLQPVIVKVSYYVSGLPSPCENDMRIEDGEDEGRTLQLGKKRILRSRRTSFWLYHFCLLGIIPFPIFWCGFGKAYTGILNLIEMAGSYIPAFLYNNQELLITTATSAILYILASYYR
ncbi:hypothetical protein NC653_040462 [Populus alba x Populus x berolinensis]|uniref:Uncharacterized protein n=1 Tax=Populus alba x Populus x berolinensis TaxID=444605 RepID=A0AAD6PPP8_9ROSI|nr:hypothetical protein NC653_040462 [Populus alba x Populus x berolinensis]